MKKAAIIITLMIVAAFYFQKEQPKSITTVIPKINDNKDINRTEIKSMPKIMPMSGYTIGITTSTWNYTNERR